MPTKKKQLVRGKPDAKKKLNGSADALAEAFRNVIAEAVQNLPTKDDYDSLLSIIEETNGGLISLNEGLVSLKREVKTDRENTNAQLREINKRLGEISRLRS